jgi:hypothetical protein
MSRPSVLNDRGERESLPIVVGGGRVLGVMVDDEFVPLEQPPADDPSKWPSSWWARIWPPKWSMMSSMARSAMRM